MNDYAKRLEELSAEMQKADQAIEECQRQHNLWLTKKALLQGAILEVRHWMNAEAEQTEPQPNGEDKQAEAGSV
jgi:hypothetical protein